MSHSVKITLIADQEIRILGNVVNIHDIGSIVLDSGGMITSYSETTQPPNPPTNDERIEPGMEQGD